MRTRIPTQRPVGQYVPLQLPIPEELEKPSGLLRSSRSQVEDDQRGFMASMRVGAPPSGSADAPSLGSDWVPVSSQDALEHSRYNPKMKLIWEDRPIEPGLYKVKLNLPFPVEVETQAIEQSEAGAKDLLDKIALPENAIWDMGCWVKTDENGNQIKLDSSSFEEDVKKGVDVEEKYGATWKRGSFGVLTEIQQSQAGQVQQFSASITGIWFYVQLLEEWPAQEGVTPPVTTVFEVPLRTIADIDNNLENPTGWKMVNEYSSTGGFLLAAAGIAVVIAALGSAFYLYKSSQAQDKFAQAALLKAETEKIKAMAKLPPAERKYLLKKWGNPGFSSNNLLKGVTAAAGGLLTLALWAGGLYLGYKIFLEEPPRSRRSKKEEEAD